MEVCSTQARANNSFEPTPHQPPSRARLACHGVVCGAAQFGRSAASLGKQAGRVIKPTQRPSVPCLKAATEIMSDIVFLQELHAPEYSYIGCCEVYFSIAVF